jgi:hypothetical protein
MPCSKSWRTQLVRLQAKESSLVSIRLNRESSLMTRTIDEIEEEAVKWWPEFLSNDPESIRLLVETHDKFLSLLKLSRPDAQGFLSLVHASDLPANVVLKHLCLLSDYGGEKIKRLAKEFRQLFPDGVLNYQYRRHAGTHVFSKETMSNPERVLSNKSLGLDGKGILTPKAKSPVFDDLLIILCFAGFSTNIVDGAFESAVIADYFGNPDKIDIFVKTRYIYVSKITSGELSNSRGQAAQQYAAKVIRESLGAGYTVDVNGKIPLPDHVQNKKGLPFDLVIKRKGSPRMVGVEVSFQVTTNSVVERKAREAHEVIERMTKQGHFVAYVVDGVGNFQRRNAWSAIIRNSHYSCAFSDKEFQGLAKFIKKSI